MIKKIEIRQTKDGSDTLYVPGLDEHYHSSHGAIAESVHVFINAGFLQLNQASFSILEIGFGTGLNALLSLQESLKKHKEIHYTALEKNPLHPDMAKSLNYPALLGNLPDYYQLHDCPWGRNEKITDQFTLFKVNEALEKWVPQKSFDLIYYDAFGPDKQPEVWAPKIIRKVASSLSPGGILVTYTAKGDIRRLFSESGLKVEKLPGPPGKREMLRARKPV